MAPFRVIEHCHGVVLVKDWKGEVEARKCCIDENYCVGFWRQGLEDSSIGDCPEFCKAEVRIEGKQVLGHGVHCHNFQ